MIAQASARMTDDLVSTFSPIKSSPTENIRLPVLDFTAKTVQEEDRVNPMKRVGNGSRDTNHRARSVVGLLAGAALGFVAHETGHVATNLALGSDMYVKQVKGAVLPFFAIAHRDALSPHGELMVSSAGLWIQSAAAEWILTELQDLGVGGQHFEWECSRSMYSRPYFMDLRV